MLLLLLLFVREACGTESVFDGDPDEVASVNLRPFRCGSSLSFCCSCPICSLFFCSRLRRLRTIPLVEAMWTFHRVKPAQMSKLNKTTIRRRLLGIPTPFAIMVSPSQAESDPLNSAGFDFFLLIESDPTRDFQSKPATNK